jgi:hypothetical protein
MARKSRAGAPVLRRLRHANALKAPQKWGGLFAKGDIHGH